jgi:hypothetical protein
MSSDFVGNGLTAIFFLFGDFLRAGVPDRKERRRMKLKTLRLRPRRQSNLI